MTQVLLPVRRGLMFQAPTAASRVQAKNAIITKGIEVMSLMVNVYDSVNSEASANAKVISEFQLSDCFHCNRVVAASTKSVNLIDWLNESASERSLGGDRLID